MSEHRKLRLSPEATAHMARGIREVAHAIAQRHMRPPDREYTAQVADAKTQAADANRRRSIVRSVHGDAVIREAQDAGLDLHPVISHEKAREIVQAVGEVDIQRDPQRGKMMTANGVTYIIDEAEPTPPQALAHMADASPPWPIDDEDDEESGEGIDSGISVEYYDSQDPRELFAGDKILVNGKMEVVRYVWGLHNPPVIVCQSGRQVDPTVETYEVVSGAFDAAEGMIGD